MKTSPINEMKVLLGKIAEKNEVGKQIELFKQALKQATDKEKELEIKNAEKFYADVAELAISQLIKNCTTDKSTEIEGLLSAIDILFKAKPSLLNHQPPLLHHALNVRLTTDYEKQVFEKLILVFFNNKADFNIRGVGGISVAHIAVAKNRELLPILTQYGCGINCKGMDGRTPLDHAGSMDVDFLYKLGAVNAYEINAWGSVDVLKPKTFKPIVRVDTIPGVILEEGGFAPAYKRKAVEKEEGEIKFPPNFDPNKGDLLNPTAAFTIIYQIYDPLNSDMNIEKMRAHISKCITLGLKVYTQNQNGKTFFDLLADEKRLNVFLGDPFIRAVFLSTKEFKPEYIHDIIELEQKETKILGPQLSAQDKEAKDLYEKDELARKALLASKQTLSATDRQLSSEAKIAVGTMVTDLRQKKTPGSLNTFKGQKNFSKLAASLNKSFLWEMVKDKLIKSHDIPVTDHRIEFINEQIKSLEKSSESVPQLQQIAQMT